MKSKQFSFLVAWLILFYSSIFCVLECSTTSLWQRTLDSSLIEAHQGSAPCLFNENIKYDKRLFDEHNSENIAVMCKTTNEDNQVSFGEDFYRMYHSKRSELVCAIAELSHKDIDRYLSTEPNIKVEMLPSYLKVHQTVVEHVLKAGTTPDVDDHRARKSSEHTSAESLVLTIEFSPMALHRQPSRILSDEIFTSFTALRSKDNSATYLPLRAAHDETLVWNAVVKSISNRTTATTCALMPHNAVEVHSHSVSVSDLSGLSLPCLVSMTHIASLSLSVLRITITSRPELVNFEARGVMQTGYMDNEPYSSAGLTGEGQVCGLADSGLNDLSCFLVDDSRGMYAGPVTDRSGVVEMGRRKVVQYTAYADKYDLEGGHGTHVGGSIVGASLSNEFSKMNGVAPDAKLSFLDIGLVDKPFLVMPPVYQLLETAYNASARVHSNSWGSTSSVYGPLSYDADRFLYDHPDSLVVFAAGNSGALGLKSIIAPANAKNALCVGAGQLREAYSDRVLSESNYSVAQFSSLGPTTDGRIKPDIIAPGDFIMSSYAGPLADLRAAVDATAAGSSGARNSSSNGGRNATAEGVRTCCAVHQLSGTSMAAPLVAGTALLIRQYFMDPRFWAALCNPRYSACQRGSFTPTGYLLKTLILHSGNAVPVYGSPLFNAQNVFASFPLGNPPDYFQGYGELLLSNILPLRSGQGLRRDLDLVVLDRMSIKPFSTITIEVDMSGRVVDHGSVSNRKKTAADTGDESDANDARDSFRSYSSNWGRENRRANDDLLTERRTASSSKGASSAAPPPFKVTISWYDPPSLMGSGSSLLVHDLDLIVETPNGDVYTGNHEGVRFNRHGSDNVNRIVTDESNPNEQVTIVKPECCSPSREDTVGDSTDGTTERERKLSGEGKNCVFKIYVQSYAMLEDVAAQNFALVITTAGVVGEPIYSMGTMPIIPLRRPNTAPAAEDHRWVRNVPAKKTREGVPANNTASSSIHDTAARRLADQLKASETTGSNAGNNTSSDVSGNHAVVVRIESALRGNQFSDTEVKVPSTGARLASVDIDLLFGASLQSGQAESRENWSNFGMRNVSIAVVDPAGAVLVVSDSVRPRFKGGGVPSKGFVSWPETSNDNATLNNYTYSARIAVKDAEAASFGGLGGNGTWRVVLTNRALFSRTLVQFNLTAAMNFEYVDEAGTGTNSSRDSNLEMPAPSVSNMPAFASEKIGLGLDSEIVVPLKVSPSYAFSTASQQSVASNKHSSSGSDERVTRTFNLSAVSLGVAASDGDQHALQQDRVLLAAFEQSGVLDSVAISLDAYQGGGVQSRGLDAWLLAVIVTAPSGLVVQVGGYQWLGQRDRFYDRRWPDVWLGRLSLGENWVSTRDVHAAQLSSLPPHSSQGGHMASLSPTTSSHTRSLNSASYPQYLRHVGPAQATTSGDIANKSNQSQQQISSSGELQWRVELAMGFSFATKSLTPYSGNLTLTFLSTNNMVVTDKETPGSGKSGGTDKKRERNKDEEEKGVQFEPVTVGSSRNQHGSASTQRTSTLTQFRNLFIVLVSSGMLVLVVSTLYTYAKTHSVYSTFSNLLYSPIQFCTTRRRRSLSASGYGTSNSTDDRNFNALTTFSLPHNPTSYTQLDQMEYRLPPGYLSVFSPHHCNYHHHKEETQSLMQSLSANRHRSLSESDLQSTLGPQPRRDTYAAGTGGVYNAISPLKKVVYHVSGRDLHRQHRELMPYMPYYQTTTAATVPTTGTDSDSTVADYCSPVFKLLSRSTHRSNTSNSNTSNSNTSNSTGSSSYYSTYSRSSDYTRTTTVSNDSNSGSGVDWTSLSSAPIAIPVRKNNEVDNSGGASALWCGEVTYGSFNA